MLSDISLYIRAGQTVGIVGQTGSAKTTLVQLIPRLYDISAGELFIGRLEKGYDTEMGQGGVNISGGQKQRLCIARAILKKPKVLILDDSTSAVDTATESRIREQLAQKLPDMTKIIIAQRISSVRHADQIIVLDDGKVQGIGTHEELMAGNEIYQEIYDSQKEGADL